MADPFAPDYVQVALSFRKVVVPNALLIVARNDALALENEFYRLPTGGGVNTYRIAHTTGLVTVDLSEVSAISIVDGNKKSLAEMLADLT